MPDDAARQTLLADPDLFALVRSVGRLSRRRYRTAARLGKAHALLRIYAAEHGRSEEWCDRVLLEFLDPDDDADPLA